MPRRSSCLQRTSLVALGRPEFETGDDIEAQYKGKSKWYKGMIARVHTSSDGVRYDILYEDGDTENDVRPSLIRRPGTGNTKLQQGDAVEGNYGGKGKWYKGKIHKLNGDGTYVILYNDGDKELKVPPRYVRAV